MGDFNSVLSQVEKRGGKPFASASRNFLGDELDTCNLIDLGNLASQMHCLLRKLRTELRKWNRRVFGWCHNHINAIKSKLEELQPLDQTSNIFALREQLQTELDEQLTRLQIKWQQKVKQRWFENGDANTKFFHLMVILQSKANFIHSIKTQEGNVVREWKHIGNEFSLYFKSLFQSDFEYSRPPPSDHLLEILPSVVTADGNHEICVIPTAEEIKATVFEMASFKSPSPDGFPPVEDAHHLFLKCPFSERIVLLSKWQVRLHPLSHLQLREWFLLISDPKSNVFPPGCDQQEFLTTWAITLELIWNAREETTNCRGSCSDHPQMLEKSLLCLSNQKNKTTGEL
ncbi:UNVERIFIED_CONTAM: hypothetical protein Scaly_1648300 [Sesamum calycinum]|uniref:Uncharacterized protein n=1 Tax=Sesamum calycinum TaxID=2727403 RepID=A0AAW2PCY7_9LAMI